MDYFEVWFGHRNELTDPNYLIGWITIRCSGRGYHYSPWWRLKSCLNPANTSTLNQRWNNVDRQRSSTLFQRWYLVENESWADVIYRCCFNVGKTTLKQRWQYYVDSTSMNQCCFNVEICLTMKVELMYVYRRCFNVDKATLKQHRKNYIDSVLSMTQCCFNVNS